MVLFGFNLWSTTQTVQKLNKNEAMMNEILYEEYIEISATNK